MLPPGVLPLPVAEMDFPLAGPVAEALRRGPPVMAGGGHNQVPVAWGQALRVRAESDQQLAAVVQHRLSHKEGNWVVVGAMKKNGSRSPRTCAHSLTPRLA